MSNIIIVSGKNHESISKFFTDRGTMDYISSYENIYENENTLLMGTYEVNKFIYINQNSDMDVKKDMIALTRILKSVNSFFTVEEIIIFSLKDEESEKLFDIVRISTEKEALVNEYIKVPTFIINTLDKPISFDGIYSKVLGISGAQTKAVEYRTLYREERNKKSDDFFDPEDFTDISYTPFDYKEVSNYERLKNLFGETDSGEIIVDENEGERQFLAIDLNRFTYSDTRRTKILHFVGDRRVGVTTHLLSVAISLLLTGKSVTIMDLSDKPDIVRVLEDNGIPYKKVQVKDLLSGTIIPDEGKLNILDTFHVTNLEFMKWMKITDIEVRTDFVLVDFPYRYREWINTDSSMVIRVEEMEESNLRNFQSISGKDLVILTSLFEQGRECSEVIAKDSLSLGVSKIIAPISINLSDVKTTLTEEVLREV